MSRQASRLGAFSPDAQSLLGAPPEGRSPMAKMVGGNPTKPLFIDGGDCDAL